MEEQRQSVCMNSIKMTNQNCRPVGITVFLSVSFCVCGGEGG